MFFSAFYSSKYTEKEMFQGFHKNVKHIHNIQLCHHWNDILKTIKIENISSF